MAASGIKSKSDKRKGWRQSLDLLGCNCEKEILVLCGIIPFGAFGWAFAFAHGILSRVACHRSTVKAGIDCTYEEGEVVRAQSRRWGARRHANRCAGKVVECSLEKQELAEHW